MGLLTLGIRRGDDRERSKNSSRPDFSPYIRKKRYIIGETFRNSTRLVSDVFYIRNMLHPYRSTGWGDGLET